MSRPMSPTQRTVLGELKYGFPGYCELMLQAGLTSYKSVDWVLSALERRGLISTESGDYEITAAGLEALNAAS